MMRASKVVNVAFLQELKESHSNLWEDVNQLGAYVQEPFCADWVEQNGGALLRRLREGLASQFRLEETFGYVDGPPGPTSKEVEMAMDQHLKIVLQCVALSEQFDDLEYSGRLDCETVAIWKQMRVLYETILEHEAFERRMLSESWGICPSALPTFLATSSQPSAHRSGR
jgi:hypothetical protein